MFDIDKWLEIFGAIRKNKLRTFLTGFSVAWGIFILMILLGSGNGLQNGVSSNFQGSAINSLWIWTGQTSIPYKGLKTGRTVQLTNEDDSSVKDVKGVDKFSSRYKIGTCNLNYGKERGSYAVEGCQPDFQAAQNLQIVEGRFVNDLDIQQNRKVVVIGTDIRDALFGGATAIGKFIRISDIPFMVVGISKEFNAFQNTDCDIPVSTAQRIFNGGNKVTEYAMTTQMVNEAQSKDIEDNIRKTIGKQHSFDPADKSALGSYDTLTDYLRTMKIFEAIKLFVWVIGIFTLFAGIVGVSNIMMIVVKERTKEIGIRKALGAKPSSVVKLIMLESILITAVAGYIGLIAGAGLMEIVSYFIDQSVANKPKTIDSVTLFLNPTVDFGIAITSTIILILAGAVAGYVPARRASRIRPIEALKDE